MIHPELLFESHTSFLRIRGGSPRFVRQLQRFEFHLLLVYERSFQLRVFVEKFCVVMLEDEGLLVDDGIRGSGLLTRGRFLRLRAFDEGREDWN